MSNAVTFTSVRTPRPEPDQGEADAGGAASPARADEVPLLTEVPEPRLAGKERTSESMNTEPKRTTVNDQQPAAPEEATPPPDPFDFERYRLPQDFGATVGVRKLLLTVPVKKPDRQAFVRTHPDERWRGAAALIELKEDRETYLVSPSLVDALAQEVVYKTLFAAVTRSNDPFIWPVTLPRDYGRTNEWNRTALEAAQAAMSKWVRVGSNMTLGAYEVFPALDPKPDPIWPEIGFHGLLTIAFKDHIIDSLDHHVVRKLRGGL